MKKRTSENRRNQGMSVCIIFVISAIIASIWNVFIKFGWHDEKHTFVPANQRTSEPCAHRGNNSQICHILCVKATTLIVYSFLFILDSFILNYLLLMNDNSQALKRSFLVAKSLSLNSFWETFSCFLDKAVTFQTYVTF